MLISYTYKFIFIKPIKAAGTSVECFLQPLCQGTSDAVLEFTAEKITDQGIVGYRGPTRGSSQYWNHMPAARIKQLHPEWFAQFAKISIVRNPYQKAISLFLWLGPLSHEQAINTALNRKQLLQNLFVLFLKSQSNISALLTDSPCLLLNGNLIIDHILRFESITSDLQTLVNSLRLPLSTETLGAYKMSGRGNHEHEAKSYFCAESLELVNNTFDWYFRLFGYRKCRSIADL
jgi:hypothetical protein